jgi:hypothetical protein
MPLESQQPDIEASVHGLILMNAFHTTANVNNSDVPQFAVPPTSTNPEASASSATVRQSRVTVFALVPDFAGGAIRSELDVDFFGGQQPSTGGRTFPLLRIRRAVAELAWNRVTLLIGQESPPIAAVSPSSLASIGFPGFAGAGNLWLWIPQLRLGADLAPGAVRGSAPNWPRWLLPRVSRRAPSSPNPTSPSGAAGRSSKDGSGAGGVRASGWARSAPARTTVGCWTRGAAMSPPRPWP